MTAQREISNAGLSARRHRFPKIVAGIVASAVVSMLVYTSPANAASSPPPQKKISPPGDISNSSIEDLLSRLQPLAQKLDDLRDLGVGSASEERARTHWRAVQAYVLEMMRVARLDTIGDRTTVASDHSGTDCDLPQQIDVAAYTASMGDLILSWREALIEIHEAAGNKRAQMLRQEAQAVYRGIEVLRVHSWLKGHLTPGAEPGRATPDATSQGAYLIRVYCTQCHAAPSPMLHSSSEWHDITAKMDAHLSVANEALPQAVKVPTPLERTLIGTYLQNNACSSARGQAP